MPKSPTNIAAAGHDSSASVSWTGVPAYLNGGFPIIVYHVDVEIENQIERSITVPAAQTSVLITGLTNGVTYTFVVVATNQVGDSLPSLPSNASYSTRARSTCAACSGESCGQHQRTERIARELQVLDTKSWSRTTAVRRFLK